MRKLGLRRTRVTVQVDVPRERDVVVQFAKPSSSRLRRPEFGSQDEDAGSGPAVHAALSILVASFLSACGMADDGPLSVSVVGGEPRLIDANTRPPRPADEVLAGATAQGLLRFDAAGAVEPGLAARWIVTDDGLSVLFRLDEDARWPDGRPVNAHFVARRLRAALAASGRNPLKPLLSVVTAVQSTTDEVLELRLAAPRANLLPLFAQPELAMVRDGVGTGPYRVASRESGRVTLERDVPGPDDDEPRRERVVLRGENAALSVARFARGGTDLVLGGRLGDLPIARAATPPAQALRFDPAAGLFGLSVVDDNGALADAGVRDALSMAVDRAALVTALNVPGLAPRATVLPVQPGGALIGAPAWLGTPLDARRRDAARLIAAAVEGGAALPLRVAMPDGPGYRLLFALLDRDWRAVGVEAIAVPPGANADLRLVDQVAPSPALAWYLEPFSCPDAAICVPEIDAALAASRVERNPAQRRAQQVAAAERIAAEALFIPLAAPIRWSLVSPRVTGFRPNALARHSLLHLRDGEERR